MAAARRGNAHEPVGVAVDGRPQGVLEGGLGWVHSSRHVWAFVTRACAPVLLLLLLLLTIGWRASGLRAGAEPGAAGPARRAEEGAAVEGPPGEVGLRHQHGAGGAAHGAGGRGAHHPGQPQRIHRLHRAGEQDLLPVPPGLSRPDGGLRHLRGMVPLSVRGAVQHPGREVRQVRLHPLRAQEQHRAGGQHRCPAHE